MHERPLSADIMRTVIREELAIAIDVNRPVNLGGGFY